jgi:hypothetical protein
MLFVLADSRINLGFINLLLDNYLASSHHKYSMINDVENKINFIQSFIFRTIIPQNLSFYTAELLPKIGAGLNNPHFSVLLQII